MPNVISRGRGRGRGRGRHDLSQSPTRSTLGEVQTTTSSGRNGPITRKIRQGIIAYRDLSLCSPESFSVFGSEEWLEQCAHYIVTAGVTQHLTSQNVREWLEREPSLWQGHESSTSLGGVQNDMSLPQYPVDPSVSVTVTSSSADNEQSVASNSNTVSSQYNTGSTASCSSIPREVSPLCLRTRIVDKRSRRKKGKSSTTKSKKSQKNQKMETTKNTRSRKLKKEMAEKWAGEQNDNGDNNEQPQLVPAEPMELDTSSEQETGEIYPLDLSCKIKEGGDTETSDCSDTEGEPGRPQDAPGSDVATVTIHIPPIIGKTKLRKPNGTMRTIRYNLTNMFYNVQFEWDETEGESLDSQLHHSRPVLPADAAEGCPLNTVLQFKTSKRNTELQSKEISTPVTTYRLNLPPEGNETTSSQVQQEQTEQIKFSATHGIPKCSLDCHNHDIFTIDPHYHFKGPFRCNNDNTRESIRP